MIEVLSNRLLEFVSDLNIAISKQFYVSSLNDNYLLLKEVVTRYSQNPTEIHKELFERWCELDTKRIFQSITFLTAQNDDWQVASIQLLPDLPIVINSLCRIADEIELRRGDLIAELNKPTDRHEAVTLPDELATPEALKIFEQARELGLIDRDYKWLKGLQLLACFAREMSLKLRLGKGNNSDGTPRISWQPFERLFNISNGKLRANYNDVQKTGQHPSDHTLIDRIFK